MSFNTTHQIIINNSSNMKEIKKETIDLVVTSPPYPMIEMWDDLFSQMNYKIKNSLKNKNGKKSFELMHDKLDETWKEVKRVLKPGGIACINIGDATRKIEDNFELFSNHTRVIEFFRNNNFSILPEIIWRKQSNKPNKFMGSGMLPTNAYVTLEHEYILIFRKGNNRSFQTIEKPIRYQSAYFWIERNKWFSDIWFDLKGINQETKNNKLRERSAAYPFDLSYRLINMYSIIGDTILDPFWGTGTTTLSAMSCARNSIGFEIDENFVKIFENNVKKIKKLTNKINNLRLNEQARFIKEKKKKQKMQHKSKKYNLEVITSQEEEILLYNIDSIEKIDENNYRLTHLNYM